MNGTRALSHWLCQIRTYSDGLTTRRTGFAETDRYGQVEYLALRLAECPSA